MLKPSTGWPCSASVMLCSQYGAVNSPYWPVGSPNGEAGSPYQTAADSCGVYPANSAIAKSSVVPVFPAASRPGGASP